MDFVINVFIRIACFIVVMGCLCGLLVALAALGCLDDSAFTQILIIIVGVPFGYLSQALGTFLINKRNKNVIRESS
jgi:hypothetical protein